MNFYYIFGVNYYIKNMADNIDGIKYLAVLALLLDEEE